MAKTITIYQIDEDCFETLDDARAYAEHRGWDDSFIERVSIPELTTADIVRILQDPASLNEVIFGSSSSEEVYKPKPCPIGACETLPCMHQGDPNEPWWLE